MSKKIMLMAAMGAAMASCGIDIDSELNRSYSFKPMTPNWKENQSEEDKKLRLQKAEEKRKRKLEKKGKSNGNRL